MASFGQRVGRTGAPLPRLWDVKILEARVFPRRTEMSGRNDLGNTSPVSELVTLYGDSRRGWPASFSKVGQSGILWDSETCRSPQRVSPFQKAEPG